MSDSSTPDSKPPEGGLTSPLSLPPPHPLDEMWYVQTETAALGPYRGDAIGQMIGQNSITRSTRVAKVGREEWAALGGVPVFKGFLAERGAAAEGVAKVAYAGFWIRLGAFALDYIILIVVFVLAALAAFATVFLIAGSMAAAIEPIRNLNGLLSLAAFSLGYFYYVYFGRSPWQATPGKRLCGIHITRADGGRVNGW